MVEARQGALPWLQLQPNLLPRLGSRSKLRGGWDVALHLSGTEFVTETAMPAAGGMRLDRRCNRSEDLHSDVYEYACGLPTVHQVGKRATGLPSLQQRVAGGQQSGRAASREADSPHSGSLLQGIHIKSLSRPAPACIPRQLAKNHQIHACSGIPRLAALSLFQLGVRLNLSSADS